MEMKHLDPNFEVLRPPRGLVAHFFDTINILGGPVGICLIFILICFFYFTLEYLVNARKKMNKKKN